MNAIIIPLWIGIVLWRVTLRLARMLNSQPTVLDMQFWGAWVSGVFLLLSTVVVRLAHGPHWIGTLLFGVSVCCVLNSLGCVVRIRMNRRAKRVRVPITDSLGHTSYYWRNEEGETLYKGVTSAAP